MVRGKKMARAFMHPNRLSPIVIAAAISACALEPESLNSERIEQRFGSYGIEVLSHSDGARRSSLYSIQDGVRVCRTYAVVQFVDEATPRVADAHADVLAGESIGATFKSSGWEINKITLYIGELPMPDLDHPVAKLMRLEKPSNLGVHAYQLVLSKDDQTVEYALITETHHPDYLSEQELHSLYGENSLPSLDDEEIRNLSTLIMDID
jgi:hypothetical protein